MACAECPKIIGNKAILEFRSEATQKNGKPYNNFYVWIMIFNDQGRAIEIREYMNSALVRETMVEN